MSSKRNPATRRQFLGQSAALAGAASLGGTLPAAARQPLRQDGPRGQRASLAEGETIKMGVIGTGGMGRGHCGSIMGIAKAGRENVQIVGVCDVGKPNLEAARKMCSEGQGIEVAAYGDYREMLARPDLHGVLIASPEHWHAQMSIDAIHAGKDVYCEKPMTLRLDDALELRTVVHENDQIFQVGTQFVSIPMWSEARDLIAAGGIGHPTTSQTSYCRNSLKGEWLYNIDENVIPGETLDWDAWCGDQGPDTWDTAVYHRWRRYRKWSTGIIGDLLVHKMTPMIMALDAGWPTRVSAVGGHYIDKAMENHDQVTLTIEFEKDHTMVVMGSTCNATGLEDLIRGHKANLYVGGNRLKVQPETLFSEEIDPETIQCESVGNDQDQHRVNWLTSMRTREKPLSDIELATKVMVIVDLATRAMWEGASFQFDPARLETRRI